MILKVYDIGRADSLLLYSEEVKDKKLMIDCGVSQTDKKNITEINLDLNTHHENHFLLTHFHRDHFRGLYHIDKNKFDKIYMNYYLKCNFISYDIHMLTKLLQIYFLARPGTLLKNRFHFILNYLYVCAVNLKPSGSIQFINFGDKINVIDDYEVIWPNMQCQQLNKELHENMIFAIEEYIEMNDFVKDNSMLNTLIDEYIRIYKRSQLSHEENQILMNGNLIEIGTQINEIIKKIDNLWEKSQEVSEQYRVSRKVSAFFNDISIVVHNEKGLYLGDVESSTVRILKPHYISSYTVVKTPHHGSNSHFDISIPSKHIFVSCSNSKRDIKMSNSYLTHFPNATHLFSNGTGLIGGKIIPGFQTVNIRIPL